MFLCLLCLACGKQELQQSLEQSKPLTSITNTQPLQEGDLLFCVQQNNTAISDVTQGYKGEKIPHVAIFHRNNEGEFALEASFMGVRLTPIDRFVKWLKLNKMPYTLVGRLNDRTNIDASVQNALKYVGRPYDFQFLNTDSAIYCSELVQICYKDKQNRLLFEPIPMSFHDSTGVVTPYWKKYYERWHLKVPEGEPGSNPGNLSRSDKLTIIYKWTYK